MTVPLARAIAALVLFGVSFGYVEAAVVVYLRQIYEPVRARLMPGAPRGELFPLIPRARLDDPALTRLLAIELGRELATLFMLGAAALAIARRLPEWLAAYAVAMGVWDISFYLFLKLFLDWPASLMTWDILFLVPVPWYGPVLAPVLVSVSMIAAGALFLWRPATLGAARWCGIVGGGLVVIVAFCWDWRNLATGGLPNPFPWWLFALGEALGVGSFVSGWLTRGGNR